MNVEIQAMYSSWFRGCKCCLRSQIHEASVINTSMCVRMASYDGSVNTSVVLHMKSICDYGIEKIGMEIEHIDQ